MLHGKSSKFSHQIYLYMRQSTEHGFKWIHYIKAIFNEAGRQDIWLGQSNSTPLSTGQIVKQILQDQFSKTGMICSKNSSKGINYSLFKDNVLFENHFKVLNDSLAKTMVRFRTGNHKLPVEVGCWNNVELALRKCQLCQASQIGDEFHLIYLFDCHFFLTGRQTLISQFYYKHRNIKNCLIPGVN